MNRIDSASLARSSRLRAAAWLAAGGLAFAAGPILAQDAPAPAAPQPPAAAAPPASSAQPAPAKPAAPPNSQAPSGVVKAPAGPNDPGAMKARVRQRVEERVSAAKGEKFKEADADGDGAVTKAEFAAYLDKRFAALDPDGDGKLAEAEFSKAFSTNIQGGAVERPPVAQSPEIAQIVMRRLDTNGDGKIDKSEAPPALLEDFDKMDENHDGALGPDDTALVQRTRERMNREAQGKAGRPQGFVERYDTNRDGKLQLEEAPDAIKRGWDKLDLNKDGAISSDETRLGREAAVEAAKKKAAESAPPAPPVAAPQPAPPAK